MPVSGSLSRQHEGDILRESKRIHGNVREGDGDDDGGGCFIFLSFCDCFFREAVSVFRRLT